MISKLTGTDIGENQGAQYRTCRFAIRPRLKVAAFAHSIRHLCRKEYAALCCCDLGSNQQRDLSENTPYGFIVFTPVEWHVQDKLDYA